MIIIRPEAASKLRSLCPGEDPPVIEFDADLDGEGEIQCSVRLVADADPEARLEEVDGITVAFRGMAESIFAGSTLSLSAEGDLTLEMAGGDCGCCDHGCDAGGCGSEESS